MGRLTRTASVGLLAMLGACASLSGVPVPSSGRYITSAAARSGPLVVEQEELLLRPVLMRGTGVLQDPATDAYVGQVARRLLAGWPTRVNIPVYLIPCDDFTAEGSANGAVFLTTGVLQYVADHPDAASEDFLAFIIAHELSHVLLGHARDRAVQQEMLHRATAVMTFVSGIMARAKNAGIAKDAITASLGILMAVEVADGSFFPGMTREQEGQADTLAIDLMGKAGYSVDAVPKVMAVLEAQDAVAAQRRQANRVEFLQPIQNGVSIQLGPYLAQMWKDQSVDHPLAADRDAAARLYIHREWDDQSVKLHQAEMAAYLRNKSVRQMLTDSQTETRAFILAGQGQSRAAAQLLLQVRSPAVRNSSMHLTTMTILATTIIPAKQFDGLVEHSLAQPYATEPLFIFRAHQLETAGHPDQALRLHQVAYQRFEDPNLFPEQIRLLHRLNRGTEAIVVAAKCYATGLNALQQLCSEASKT